MDEINEVINSVMTGYRKELSTFFDDDFMAKIDGLFLVPLALNGYDEISGEFVAGFCNALSLSGQISETNADRLEQIINSARALILLDL